MQEKFIYDKLDEISKSINSLQKDMTETKISIAKITEINKFITEDINAIKRNIKALSRDNENTKIDLARIKTKVAIYITLISSAIATALSFLGNLFFR